MKKYSIQDIREEFPWFKKNKGWIYFDNAATTLKPKNVINAVLDYYEKISTNFHNTDSQLTYNGAQSIINAKKEVADWLKCNVRNVAFSYGTTDSINLFAHGLEDKINKGNEIVITKDEHASNLLPWWNLAQKKHAKLKIVEVNNFKITSEDFLTKVTEKTKIVAFTGASNIYGYINDYEKIARKIKKKNPNLVIAIDAAQYVQHRQITIDKNSKIDLLSFSMHKLYGPTGIGISYIKDNLIGIIKPLRLGGGIFSKIEDNASKKINFVNNISLYEGGTQNLSSIYAIPNTIKFLKKINYEKLLQHEIQLTKYLITKLKKIKEIHILNEQPDIPIVSFNYEGIHSQDFANYLGKNKIIVRSGNSCVPLINSCKWNKMEKNIQCNNNFSGFVRVSFAIYNTYKEIDKLINVIKKFNKKEIY